MDCLNLSNGDFTLAQFTAADFNAGPLTITVDGTTSIEIERVGFAASLFLNGRWEHCVYGGNEFVALLRFIPGAPGSSQRTLFIVDFTGPTMTTVEIHEQGTVQDSVGRPQIMMSQGNQALTFVWSPTGDITDPNGVQRMNIFRSDNGDLVMQGPVHVSNINGTIGASLTATQLTINHPNQFDIPSDSTSMPRPTGNCSIPDDHPDFGEAVLGATNAALATTTRTVTIRNTGLDCLTITAIANNAPFTVAAASAAALPVVLPPDGEFDVDLVFAPTATGNNITRTLAVTRAPANGDDQIVCKGKARQAVAQISTAPAALPFGTLVHPGTQNSTFTVSNSGEVDLTITIAGPPAGSDFAWASIAAPGLALPVGTTTPPRTVTYTTSGDGPATTRTISVVPSGGAATRTIDCTGAGCIPNAVIALPAVAPIDLGIVERGFRTVRFIEITNGGDTDLTFRASIAAGANPAQAANFGLVLPENDITDAPGQRNYSVLPATRCGPGATGPNTVVVAVSFFADGANGAYGASLVIDNHNATNGPASQTWPLTATVIDPVPVDIAVVLDRSGSMNDPAWSRNKMEAALAGARLLVQMLRDTADDRCALVGFNETPVAVQHMELAGANRAALLGALGPPAFVPNGATNIAGGAIVATEELATAHPTNPPVLKKAMVVLTDGMENRCLQIGGVDPWFSITGRDANAGMERPDGTPQDTDPWPAPTGVKVYAIGLGGANDIDAAALTQLAVTTGGSFQGAEDLTGQHFFLLEKYFTQIFMETAGLAQIADPFYTIQPGTRHAHQFDILPGDVNAMVVLYDQPGQRLPFWIESPKGEVLSGNSLPAGFSVRTQSTPTARFVEFFFPNKEPDRYAGLWTVWVLHDGTTYAGELGKDDIGPGFVPRKGRKTKGPVDYGIAIAAGSNLRMQPFVDPDPKYVGDPIRLNALVTEAGLPVKGSNVRVTVLSPSGQQYVVPLRDDGAHQDGAADDGDYGGVFTQTYVAGSYQLEFRAEGLQGTRPYTRSAHRTKVVQDKRQPPGDGGSGGSSGDGDCCRKLLRELRQQRAILVRLLKATEHRRDADKDSTKS